MNEIRESLTEKQAKTTVRQLFSKRLGVSHLVWVGIALAALQQFVGINVIFYYSSTLWQAVGFGADRSLLISVVSAWSTSSVHLSPSPSSTGSVESRCCWSVPPVWPSHWAPRRSVSIRQQ